MISRKEARGIIRKALKRVPEGEEIRHLNIMPMMDIMTILLVAFLFSANQDAAFSLGDAEVPESRSYEKTPKQAMTLTITTSAILIEGEPIVEVANGDVDPSLKKHGALGIQIPKLSNFLGSMREIYEEEQRKKGKDPKDAPPELFIIADKRTPYKLLFQVIVSSRSDAADFRRFRLIVLQAGETLPEQSSGGDAEEG